MLPESRLEVDMIYGTAWKGDDTGKLVTLALDAGFRAFDTAAQPKHYREDLVGKAIRDAVNAGIIDRKDIYLQTKFTPPSGQDPGNCPYDLPADITSQVTASVNSSLHNLRHSTSESPTDGSYIDCLILHSPLPQLASSMEAWNAMSTFFPERVRSLGISNTTLPVLRAICSHAQVKPSIVQNRFHAKTGWDVELRKYCQDNQIAYEAFWTLTANPHLANSELVGDVASTVGVEKEVALYALIRGLSIYVLNGTSQGARMGSDISGFKKIHLWKRDNTAQWTTWMSSFEQAISSISPASPVGSNK